MDHRTVVGSKHSPRKVALPAQRNRKYRLYTNKLYRTDGERSESHLEKLEKAFVLDCVAVAQISEDYGHANPKVGSSIPIYNGQLDPYAKSYFESRGIQKVLEHNGQKPPGTCIEGPFVARFAEHGPPAQYLRRRNRHGCGRSLEVFRGHDYQQDASKAIDGYNGLFGYRRNTPFLRMNPSSFGVVTDLPLH